MAEYFNIGKLVAVYGLKGELLLNHEMGENMECTELQTLFIEEKKQSFLPYFIESAKKKSGSEIYIKLEGINTRETAQLLLRKLVWLSEADFKKLVSPDVPAALLGYTIIHNHKPLGEILELIQQPHQVLCRIEIKGKEVLIPLHEAFLKKINHKKREVVVNLPEGLLQVYL